MKRYRILSIWLNCLKGTFPLLEPDKISNETVNTRHCVLQIIRDWNTSDVPWVQQILNSDWPALPNYHSKWKLLRPKHLLSQRPWLRAMTLSNLASFTFEKSKFTWLEESEIIRCLRLFLGHFPPISQSAGSSYMSTDSNQSQQWN